MQTTIPMGNRTESEYCLMTELRLFTSESVTEGHPDKMCDQISDAILDDMLRQDPRSRVAVETLVTTGLVLVAGEVTTSGYSDINRIVRDTVLGIGYDSSDVWFDGRACGVEISIGGQSPDIAAGVDAAHESREKGSEDDLDKQGAGDQGIMFGYATNETPTLMPLPIWLAHRLSEKLSTVRRNRELDFLRPDGKTQVTIGYDGTTPATIDTIVLSTQHSPKVGLAELRDAVAKVIIDPVLETVDLPYSGNEYLINPTGIFEIGGPHGDAGLTGRKIIVDTYGGASRHGGGAFSGKDPSKVDRSAAYAMALGGEERRRRRPSRTAPSSRSPTRSARRRRSASTSRRSARRRCRSTGSRRPSARSSTSVRPRSSATCSSPTGASCPTRRRRRSATSAASSPASPGSAPTASPTCRLRQVSETAPRGSSGPATRAE